MGGTMRAFQLVEWLRPPEFREVPVPTPGPGQVLVKMGGVGLCHTDEMFFHAPPGAIPYELPFTLGHENAGWVAGFGAGTDRRGLAEGDPVIVFASSPCGTCHYCRLGSENNCVMNWIGRGYGRDGGLAEYLLVDTVQHLVPLGALDPTVAGPLCDAATTAYHAVARTLSKLPPEGGTAVVIGTGGLGGYAVQWLRLQSTVRVIVVDTAQHRLDHAAVLGAHETVLSGDDVDARLADLTGGQGAEVVLDFVGVDATMATAVNTARRLGTVGIIGAGKGTVGMQWGVLPFECDLWCSQASTLSDLHQVVELAQSGRVNVDVDPFPFDRTPEAYAALAAGTVKSRAVVQL